MAMTPEAASMPMAVAIPSRFSHFCHLNHTSFFATQRQVIALKFHFDRITEGSNFLHLHFSARHNAHIHQAAFDFTFSGQLLYNDSGSRLDHF